MRKTSVLALMSGTIALSVALACSAPGSPAPGSPAAPSAEGLGPGGSTLKVPAPNLVSPANNQQVTVTQNVPLVASNVAGTNASFPVTLEYEVRLLGSTPGGTLIANPKIAQSGGSTTTYTFPNNLETSALYTWRVRATYSGAFGPWSSLFTFKAPDIPPSYITSNEIYDSLADGKTVGQINGPVQFIPGQGVKLLGQESSIEYLFNQPLINGTFSLMMTGADESNPGDKSKVMSMMEGSGDITANDYRVTAELRGQRYITPGAVQARIITGDAGEEDEIHDTARIVVDFNDEQWYLWRVTWRTGSFTLEVRENGPTGAIKYSQTISTGTTPYRPLPHRIFVGSPVGRNGVIDSSVAGMIVKNVWVSATQTRPPFAFEVFSSPSGR